MSSNALLQARRIRGILIDLSYELPDPPSRPLMDAWSKADSGLHALVLELEKAEAPDA